MVDEVAMQESGNTYAINLWCSDCRRTLEPLELSGEEARQQLGLRPHYPDTPEAGGSRV